MTAKISGPVLASKASRNICSSSDVCKPLAFSFLPCSNSSFHVNKKNLNSQPCTNPNTTFRYLRFYLVLSCVLSFEVKFKDILSCCIWIYPPIYFLYLVLSAFIFCSKNFKSGFYLHYLAQSMYLFICKDKFQRIK